MSMLRKRLSALEATRGTTDLSHLSDDELRERIEKVSAELEAYGITIPAGFDAWRFADQRVWLRAESEALG